MMSLRHEIRSLSSSVRTATDEQIALVVATIDRMEMRGVADALVAPLRGRLRALAVPRPRQLRRLCFEPLDSLIVDSAVWKRAQPFVPRSALVPLFEIMQRENPELCDGGQLLVGPESYPSGRAQLCAKLWLDGARALQSSPAPANWRQTSGLADADYYAIRSVVVVILEQADRLCRLDPRAEERQILAELREILTAAAQGGALAWQAMLVLLFSQSDFVALAVRLGQELATTSALAVGLDAAFKSVSAVLQGKLDLLGDSVSVAPMELANMVDIIVDLEAAAGPRSERKRTAEVLRRNASQLCAKAVARVVEQELIPALKRDGNEPQPEVQSIAETAARSVRALGLVAERLGVSDKYDARARAVVVHLTDTGNCFDPIDRARLLEILGRGSEAQEVLRAFYAARALIV